MIFTEAEFLRIKLFHGTQYSAIEHILSKCPIAELAENEVLLRPGSRNNNVYILLSGKLRIHVFSLAEDYNALFDEGECVGELSSIDDEIVSAFVVAHTTCRMLKINQVLLEILIGASHQVAINLLSILSQRMRTNNQTIIEINKRQLLLTKIEQQLRRDKISAEHSNQAKGDFLATMSHEIRTPLNGILGMTQLLLDSPLNTVQQEQLDTINRSGEALLTVINDILDFSKIEAGKLTLEHINFDLHRTLKDIYTMFKELAIKKKIGMVLNINPNVPRLVKGDTYRLRQILVNLLSNALKFTEQGMVELTVSLQETTEKSLHILFLVKDSGIGIKAEKLASLFEPYTQAEASTTRKFGGTGLGLSITKKLAEMMQGNIHASSEPGKGSLFAIKVRFGKVANQKMQEQIYTDEPHPLAKNTKILIVEDNIVNQQVLLGMLKYIGVGAEIARNGKEALLKLKNKRYDIVLMDGQMPELDGFETTKRFRDYEARLNLPRTTIIALTGMAMKGDRDKCLKVGMDDYLTKPIRRNVLRSALVRWLSDPIKDTTMDSIEIIDHIAINELINGQRGNIANILTTYFALQTSCINKIDTSLKYNDKKALITTLELLCESSRQVGASRLLQCLSKMFVSPNLLQQCTQNYPKIKSEADLVKTMLTEKYLEI